MAFQQFVGNHVFGAAYVSYGGVGVLYISTGAVKQFAFEGNSHVRVYFDPETRLVGLELTNETEKAYRIRATSSGCRNIGLAAFCSYWQLSITGRKALTLDEASGLLVFPVDAAPPHEGNGMRQLGRQQPAAGAAR